mmetsp:Transcript_84109/g.151824  ORF Transcript_84109/g.151824 Transcript_84109/m.151824 type:complete len:220 (-) Transcript_84109:1392-2051(-)
MWSKMSRANSSPSASWTLRAMARAFSAASVDFATFSRQRWTCATSAKSLPSSFSKRLSLHTASASLMTRMASSGKPEPMSTSISVCCEMTRVLASPVLRAKATASLAACSALAASRQSSCVAFAEGFLTSRSRASLAASASRFAMRSMRSSKADLSPNSTSSERHLAATCNALRTSCASASALARQSKAWASPCLSPPMRQIARASSKAKIASGNRPPA